MFRNIGINTSFGREDMALKRQAVPWADFGSRLAFLRFRCWLRSSVSFFMLMLAFEIWVESRS